MIAQYMIDTLGMELLIVAVTLGFAMIIKNHTKAVKVTDKLSKKYEQRGKRKTPPSSPRLTQAQTPEVSRQQARASRGGGGSEMAPVAARQMPFVPFPRRAAPYKATWKIAEEIIVGAREQPGPGFAGRALSLFVELRSNLRDRDERLVNVPWHSKYRQIDLYVALVQCAIRVGKPQLLPEIVADMIHQGVSRTLYFYECAMKQLAGMKQFHLALRMYDRLVADGFEASAVTLSCLISFAFEVGELDRAVGFFGKLKLINTPSIRAYMTLLRIHARRQDWPASMETLRDMQTQGVALDNIALNVVFATGVAADRIEEVETLLAEADAHNPPLSDIVSYNTLIKGYAYRSNGEGAARAIERLRKQGLVANAITFNSAMDAAVRSPRGNTAWVLLRQMRSSGLKPDKFTCSILVKSLSTCNVSSERILDTLSLLREVSAKDCGNTLRSSMYNLIFEAAVKIEDGGLLAQVQMQMRSDRVTPTRSTQRITAHTVGGRSESPWCDVSSTRSSAGSDRETALM